MKYETLGDLYIAAGESIKMQKSIVPLVKVAGELRAIALLDLYCLHGTVDFEFPLAVVEGKPVFVGDELYHNYYGFCKIGSPSCAGVLIAPDNANCFSWNPPKPKTVMVELLREDAEVIAKNNMKYFRVYPRIACSIHKALGEQT